MGASKSQVRLQAAAGFPEGPVQCPACQGPCVGLTAVVAARVCVENAQAEATGGVTKAQTVAFARLGLGRALAAEGRSAEAAGVLVQVRDDNGA